MNKLFKILCAIVMLIMASCNSHDELNVKEKETKGKNTEKPDTGDDKGDKDDSKTSTGSNSERSVALNKTLRAMLPYADYNSTLDFSHMNIDEPEAEEIKNFSVSQLNKATKLETIEYVNHWLFQNITYYVQNTHGRPKDIKEGRSINDPYEAFKYRKAICYGFSNLMKVVLNSLDIPAVVVSGWLVSIGDSREAHSWVIAKGEDGWVVADPTNDRFFGSINNEDSPYTKRLSPITIDARMFEDTNFIYNFYEGVNISEIKGTPASITLPGRVYGLDITSFNPKNNLPNSLTSVKLNSNITFLGERAFGLNKYGNNLQNIEVEAGNHNYNSYKGVLYKNGDKTPIYIPHKITELILKPQPIYGKNVVTNRDYITSIVFPEGTERIKSYAVEHCPALMKVKVPESTIIEENAFYKKNKSSIKIIRY